MKHMKLLMMMGIVAIVFAGLAGAAQAKARGSLNVTLDSYEPNNDGFAGAVSTKNLPEGSRWVAVVQGTFSYYEPSQYSSPSKPFKALCGTPDLSGPLFASPDKPAGGPVGMDAEFLISRPARKASWCASHPLPHRWPNFEMRTGKLSPYQHYSALGPTLYAPTADHTYSYPLVGWGQAAQFRLKDRPRTSDNYGELKISLRPATAGDCGNYDWESFGYHSQPECETALGGTSAAT
jgi:hypothetical protein